MNEFLRLIKKAAVEAVEAGKPAALLFGKVTSSSPLKVNVEQKMTLTKEQLILTRNVTDYKTEVTVDWKSEDVNDESSEVTPHSHDITGKKEVTIHNSLSVGDDVVLLRMQGGQKFLIIDKVVKA